MTIKYLTAQTTAEVYVVFVKKADMVVDDKYFCVQLDNIKIAFFHFQKIFGQYKGSRMVFLTIYVLKIIIFALLRCM